MEATIKPIKQCIRIHEKCRLDQLFENQIPSNGHSDGHRPILHSTKLCPRDLEIPGMYKYQIRTHERLVLSILKEAGAAIAQAQEGCHSPTLPSALHDLSSFSPPPQTLHVSSIPLSVVYEPKLPHGSLHMTHVSHINSRRSVHSIQCHKQRAHWHEDILPKLI